MRVLPTRLVGSVGVVLVLVGCGGGGGEVVVADEPAVETPEPGLYFPPVTGDWETVDAAEVGWDTAGLDAVLAYAREQRSSGLVVALEGRILAEAYWEVLPDEAGANRYQNLAAERTDEGRAIEDVASVQKSVVSFLVGVARGKGLLSLDDPVSDHIGAGWSEADAEAEKAILLRHIMSMSSGLATDRTFETPAGEKWMYNTNVYSRAVPVLEAVSGLKADEYTSQWLTGRIGMSNSYWGPRPWVLAGQDANRIGFRSTARDLARFGILTLAGGTWAGEDLLGDGTYLAVSLAPSQTLNPSYGLLWWLNGQGRTFRPNGTEVEGDMFPTAPTDMVAALGALGRKIYVVPSLGLVVTRLGDQPAPDFDDEVWRLLMAAAPAQPGSV